MTDARPASETVSSARRIVETGLEHESSMLATEYAKLSNVEKAKFNYIYGTALRLHLEWELYPAFAPDDNDPLLGDIFPIADTVEEVQKQSLQRARELPVDRVYESPGKADFDDLEKELAQFVSVSFDEETYDELGLDIMGLPEVRGIGRESAGQYLYALANGRKPHDIRAVLAAATRVERNGYGEWDQVIKGIFDAGREGSVVDPEVAELVLRAVADWGSVGRWPSDMFSGDGTLPEAFVDPNLEKVEKYMQGTFLSSHTFGVALGLYIDEGMKLELLRDLPQDVAQEITQKSQELTT